MRRPRRAAPIVLTVPLLLLATACGNGKTTTSSSPTPTTPAVKDEDVSAVVKALTKRDSGEPEVIDEEQATCVAKAALPKVSDTGRSFLLEGLNPDDSGGSSGTPSGGDETSTTGKAKKVEFKDLDKTDSDAVVEAFDACLPIGDFVKALTSASLGKIDMGAKEVDCVTDKLKTEYSGSGELLKIADAEEGNSAATFQKVFRVTFRCLDESNQRTALGALFAPATDDPTVASCLSDLAVSGGSAEDLFTSLIDQETAPFESFLQANGVACGLVDDGGLSGTSPDTSLDYPTEDPAPDGTGVGGGI